MLPSALDHKAGEVWPGRRGWGLGNGDGDGFDCCFFSYGFRHPLMLIENFFEYPCGVRLVSVVSCCQQLDCFRKGGTLGLGH